MAGRVLRISAPIVGSKLTSQTSPRLGTELLDNIASLPGLALRGLLGGLVMLYHLFR